MNNKTRKFGIGSKAQMGPGGRLCPCCNKYGPPHKHKKKLNRLVRRKIKQTDRKKNGEAAA